MPTKAINIWSSPRNISTAFMYSFAQRNDMTVVDEPLYAHYLKATDVEHPGKNEILASQSQVAKDVIENVILKTYPTPYSLHKQMTHHLVDMDWDFMRDCKNILLIRNPREIIASYAKVIPYPKMRDVGIRKQMELYQYLKKYHALHGIVDTNELLKHPQKVLRQLCSQLDIPFDMCMLEWGKGARPEDGVWAKYWYSNVHQSTGFQPYQAKHPILTEELESLAKQCMPYYDELYQHCIKSDI